MDTITVTGTLRWNEFEGGFWSIEPEEASTALVLDGWAPVEGGSLTSGSRVRARVREREEQFGFVMAGTYVDVVELEPA